MPKLTTEEFIKRARATHGDRYGYDLVDYINSTFRVNIVCAEHGHFLQKPSVHLQGQGCPRCQRNYDQPTQLYLLTNGEKVKIGISQDVGRRMRQHRKRGQPFTSELLATWSLPDHPAAREVESKVHRLLSNHNAFLTGFDGATEWFSVSPQVAVDAVKRCLP